MKRTFGLVTVVGAALLIFALAPSAEPTTAPPDDSTTVEVTFDFDPDAARSLPAERIIDLYGAVFDTHDHTFRYDFGAGAEDYVAAEQNPDTVVLGNHLAEITLDVTGEVPLWRVRILDPTQVTCSSADGQGPLEK